MQLLKNCVEELRYAFSHWKLLPVQTYVSIFCFIFFVSLPVTYNNQYSLTQISFELDQAVI